VLRSEKKQAEHGRQLYQVNDWKYCSKLLILQSPEFWQMTRTSPIRKELIRFYLPCRLAIWDHA
jgi:hypothetical protein